MTAQGCSYNEGSCFPIIDECKGCQRCAEFATGIYCIAAPDPALKWKNGTCNMATHVKTVTETKKQKVNPIKASKRR
ncbi:MAG: PxxKW family cysteine-rich protein, partial [Thermodesulfobacteriota bacterium]